MRTAQGGTKIYCPFCTQVRICQAIPTTELGLPPGQRWYRKDHADIQWFRRGRKCLTCNNSFISAEVDEDFIDELVELRIALASIKSNAEQYVKESTAASASLNRLTNALSVLRALKVYRDTEPSVNEEFQGWEVEARDLLSEGKKIEAIKLVREALNCGLKEAKDLSGSTKCSAHFSGFSQ
jgi:ribosomal protein L7/L12